MNFNIILICCFGAIIQEVIHWYDLRDKLEETTYKSMLGSWRYWIITLAMIVISGLASYILFEEEIESSKSLQLLMGAAFPLIFKKMVSGFVTKNFNSANEEPNPQPEIIPQQKFKLEQYFR